jgi:hypothetical protein
LIEVSKAVVYMITSYYLRWLFVRFRGITETLGDFFYYPTDGQPWIYQIRCSNTRRIVHYTWCRLHTARGTVQRVGRDWWIDADVGWATMWVRSSWPQPPSRLVTVAHL